MAEEYQVTLEEKQDLYFNVFKEEYKNCKKFRNRKRIYFIVSFIAIFFSCLSYSIDAAIMNSWQRSFYVTLFFLFITCGYILPRFLNWGKTHQLYLEYWKLRKCLCEENIFIEKIIFSYEGIKILEYDREKKVSDFSTYQNVAKMSFYKTGIILLPNKKEYIYIPSQLFKNRKDIEQIKKWYEEKHGYGENSI